jgi:hypothetical protein
MKSLIYVGISLPYIIQAVFRIYEISGIPETNFIQAGLSTIGRVLFPPSPPPNRKKFVCLRAVKSVSSCQSKASHSKESFGDATASLLKIQVS